MLKLAIVRVVDLSTRYPWWVIVIALTLSLASAVYVERRRRLCKCANAGAPWTLIASGLGACAAGGQRRDLDKNLVRGASTVSALSATRSAPQAR